MLTPLSRLRLLVIQPTPYCNISCTYCYLKSRHLRHIMKPEVVQRISDAVLAALPPEAEVDLVWHAGEPTTAPIAWYHRAYEKFLAAKPAGLRFALQTNGISIDPDWVDLFKQTRTNIGLSIDGPREWHDRRRVTKNGKPTWDYAVRALSLLRSRGVDVNIISVLSPGVLDHAEQYFDFCVNNEVTSVSFNIDEREGGNTVSSFDGEDHKPRMTVFLERLLELSYARSYPLKIREVERVAQLIISKQQNRNELCHPFEVLTIAHDGSVSTFSPEITEASAPQYDNFAFGNLLEQSIGEIWESPTLQKFSEEVAAGISECADSCSYFSLCGGGSPVNKVTECGTAAASETEFCRLTTQATSDAFLSFLRKRQPAQSGVFLQKIKSG